MLRIKAAPLWRAATVALALALGSACAASASGGTERVEWVLIDGAKNPELIPEWSAWEDVFSTIGGGLKVLPTTVHTVVTEEEARLIFREAEASLKRTADCNTRILALKPLVPREGIPKIIARTKEIRLDCRWGNLHARDRLLAALNPKARAALSDFAALMKAGTKFTVAKSEVAFLRLPQ